LGACALLVGPVEGQHVFDDDTDAGTTSPPSCTADDAADAVPTSVAIVDAGGFDAEGGPAAPFQGDVMILATEQGTPEGIVATADALYWSSLQDATLRRLAIGTDGLALPNAVVETVFSFADAGGPGASDLIVDGTTLYALVGPNATLGGQQDYATACNTFFVLNLPSVTTGTCVHPSNLCNAATTASGISVTDTSVFFATGRDCGNILGAPKPIDVSSGWTTYLPASQSAPVTALASTGNAIFYSLANQMYDIVLGAPDASTPFGTPSGDIGDIVADSDSVYWTTDTMIESLLGTTGPASPSPLATNQSSPQRLTFDDTYVYWTTKGTAIGEGTVAMAPKDGSGPSVILQGSQWDPWGIAVTGVALYWTNSGDNTVVMLKR
jgi:hypothetical protein